MDKTVMEFFQRVVLPSGVLTHFMYGITAVSEAGLVWVLLAVGFLFHPRTRTLGVAMGVALLCMLLMNNVIIKGAVGRLRPYQRYELDVFITRLTSFSFPSGHASSSFAAAVCIVRYSRKWGIAALILAAVISFSRVYFSMHYLTDILFGAGTGVVYAWIGLWYARKYWPTHFEWLKVRFRRKQS